MRFAYAIAGLLVTSLGVVGWILPFVPGLPLVIVGLSMMATVHPAAHGWCERLKARSASSVRKWWSRPPSPSEVRSQFSGQTRGEPENTKHV